MNATAMVLGFAMLTGCGGGAFSAGDEKVARDDAGGEASADDAGAREDDAGGGRDANAQESGSNVDADTGKSCQVGNAMWPGVCCYLPAVAGCAFVETSPNTYNTIPACCAPDEPLSACTPSTPMTASKLCGD